jgi:hypothetical protein
VIAGAGSRHRDLFCRLGIHRLVRYPRAIGVDAEGREQITDDTYCQRCERLISRRVVACGELVHRLHQLCARGISPGSD